MVHLPKLNYECIHCGQSCQMFEVTLDPGQVLDGAVEGKLQCIEKGCPHLGEGPLGRCQVYSQRPNACRDFPFRVTETPGGSYVGASYACTAISQNLGPALTDADKDWSKVHRLGAQQVDLRAGQPCSWDTYLQLEEYLSDQLCFPHGTFIAALGASLSLTHQHPQWGQLPLKWLSDEVELVSRRTLRGLFALCEADQDSDLAKQVLMAQGVGGRYFSPLFQCWCEPEKIRPLLQSDQEEHWQVAEGFFRHLVFRKFLWGAPSVHARLCLLPLINEMIHFWSWVPAMAQSCRPSLEHRRLAIREIERRLTFHSTGWESYLGPLSAAFLEGVA